MQNIFPVKRLYRQKDFDIVIRLSLALFICLKNISYISTVLLDVLRTQAATFSLYLFLAKYSLLYCYAMPLNIHRFVVDPHFARRERIE